MSYTKINLFQVRSRGQIVKHHFDSISHSPSCLFVKNIILKLSSIRFILKTSLSLRVKRVTDEDGEVRDGTTRPFGPFSPSVTSPPTWKAGRTDRLPHFPLNSAEKRRRCGPLLSFHAETTQKMKCDHVRLVGFP